MDENTLNNSVRQAAQGDMDALTALLGHFGPTVEASLRIGRRWQDNLDVGDVMQVTYLEAFLQIQRFDPARGRSFLSWLRQIAANNLRDAIRGLSGANRPPVALRVSSPSLEESASMMIADMGFTTTTPSRTARVNEASGILLEALERLPPDYREVVRKYDLEGVAIGEIAATMNRSPGALHMLRGRAHERLREILGESRDYLESRA